MEDQCNACRTMSPYNRRPNYQPNLSLQWRQNGHDRVSNHQPNDCLLNRLFRRRSTKIWILRVTGLCEGNSTVTSEFPAQSASNVENVSIRWRYHGDYLSSQVFCGTSEQFHKNLICNVSLEVTLLILQTYLPGTKELNILCSMKVCFLGPFHTYYTNALPHWCIWNRWDGLIAYIRFSYLSLLVECSIHVGIVWLT